MRSLYRSIYGRSHNLSSSAAVAFSHRVRRLHFSLQLSPALSPNQSYTHRVPVRLGGARFFSEDVSHMPEIKDPEIKRAFMDLMATNWDELPPSVVEDVKNSLSKNSEDKNAQEVLKNVFRAAEAVEEFGDIIMSLKMEMDDLVGMSGENVKPLPEDHAKAMQTIFDRYNAYLAAFGPEENYLKKKVETELGSKMIYLKMRCGGLSSDWGKVTVLGTSGLSGSYVEKRA